MILTRFAVGLAAVALAGGQTIDKLELHNVHGEATTYRQKAAIHLRPASDADRTLAIVKGPSFQDGTIDAEVAGAPAPGVGDFARGFIGIAFRVQGAGSKLELFYIRPTNGRADDQLRRNHSVQYESVPDWPWNRLRQEAPGVYESYSDLETGAWTKLKITVSGAKARLYINGAAQPCLIVNDLKLAPASGAVALWVGPGTEGYFSNLRVTPQ